MTPAPGGTWTSRTTGRAPLSAAPGRWPSPGASTASSASPCSRSRDRRFPLTTRDKKTTPPPATHDVRPRTATPCRARARLRPRLHQEAGPAPPARRPSRRRPRRADLRGQAHRRERRPRRPAAAAGLRPPGDTITASNLPGPAQHRACLNRWRRSPSRCSRCSPRWNARSCSNAPPMPVPLSKPAAAHLAGHANSPTTRCVRPRPPSTPAWTSPLTPAFLKRFETVVPEKQLSERLARDQLIPVAHGVRRSPLASRTRCGRAGATPRNSCTPGCSSPTNPALNAGRRVRHREA